VQPVAGQPLSQFRWASRRHLKNLLGCGSLRYEIASSSGENVLAVSQRIHLHAFSPCILALS
jgi:hypothetical protein